MRGLRRRIGTAAAVATARLGRADVAVFHEFAPPPIGGGHQFMRALVRELERRGLRVERNRLSAGTGACLCNSFNFDFARLRRLARPDARVVHRVDGPIGVYRGFDDGTDRRIWGLNQELADATVFQSSYSLERHRELGLEFVDPVVITNAPDPGIFHPHGRAPFAPGGKIRLITTSWSDNPRKGADVLAAAEPLIDWSRYEFTFVGRTPVRFERIRVVDPVGSERLAELLRAHDVYVTASRDDPCSNALLEALACGLPAAYLASGGHPELVGRGGVPFASADELPAALDRLGDEWEERRAQIVVPSLSDVVDRYVSVMRLDG